MDFNNLKSKKLSSVHSLISEVLGVVSKLDVEYRNLELNPEDYPNGFNDFTKVYQKGTPILHEIF